MQPLELCRRELLPRLELPNKTIERTASQSLQGGIQAAAQRLLQLSWWNGWLLPQFAHLLAIRASPLFEQARVLGGVTFNRGFGRESLRDVAPPGQSPFAPTIVGDEISQRLWEFRCRDLG